VIGVVAAVLLLGDRPTGHDLIGFGLIFVAALLLVGVPLLAMR